MTEIFSRLLEEITRQPVLVDVGARGGALDQWRAFEGRARVVCFEPDEKEVRRLGAAGHAPNVEYVPAALFSDERDLRIFITEEPACSSFYAPSEALYARYPGLGIIRPVGEMSCPATTLDAYLRSRDIDGIDALKIDTQGSELDILKGADRALATCWLVEVEVEFNPLYDGQPLFADVDSFLRERGFVLWRFNTLAHYATEAIDYDRHQLLLSADPAGGSHVSSAAGQLFWADAVYVKRDCTPVSSASMSRTDAMVVAALACQLKYWDLALAVVRKAGDEKLAEEMRQMMSSSLG